MPELVALRDPDVHERRRTVDALFAAAAAVRPPNGDVSCEDRVTDSGVPVRISRPTGQEADLPGVLWIHGGGMTIGSIAVSENAVIGYVTAVPCVAVSVEYRLAPE